MQRKGIDLLFPSRAIEYLQDLRGEKWKNLVSSLLSLEPTSIERIAFVLMLVRMSGCASCQSDSFRAMRGCVLCSSTTVKRFKGNDQILIDLYIEAKKDVVKYMDEKVKG